jgi:ParB family chromosome partitioning protein
LGQAKPRRRRPSSVSVNASAIENLQSRLQEHLGTRVVLHHGEKQGRIEIEYYGADDLQRIVQVMGLAPEN